MKVYPVVTLTNTINEFDDIKKSTVAICTSLEKADEIIKDHCGAAVRYFDGEVVGIDSKGTRWGTSGMELDTICNEFNPPHLHCVLGFIFLCRYTDDGMYGLNKKESFELFDSYEEAKTQMEREYFDASTYASMCADEYRYIEESSAQVGDDFWYVLED